MKLTELTDEIRYKLIRRLAGDRIIILNAEIHGEARIPTDSRYMIQGCTFISSGEELPIRGGMHNILLELKGNP